MNKANGSGVVNAPFWSVMADRGASVTEMKWVHLHALMKPVPAGEDRAPDVQGL